MVVWLDFKIFILRCPASSNIIVLAFGKPPGIFIIAKLSIILKPGLPPWNLEKPVSKMFGPKFLDDVGSYTFDN